MLNKYFLNLARVSADIAGYPIRPEWIYSQWAHETGNFTSNLTSQYHNLGGLTQTTPNDTPQPDGSCYYMQFSSFEDYAKYFGRYLQYYREDGIYNSQSIDDYVTALKHGGYFGDSLTNYLTSVKQIYEENFSYSTTPAGYNANTTGNEILQNSYGDLGNNTIWPKTNYVRRSRKTSQK